MYSFATLRWARPVRQIWTWNRSVSEKKVGDPRFVVHCHNYVKILCTIIVTNRPMNTDTGTVQQPYWAGHTVEQWSYSICLPTSIWNKDTSSGRGPLLYCVTWHFLPCFSFCELDKFLYFLANSCHRAEKPVIMSKCWLLLINSYNYRGESLVAVRGNHSSALQCHSCASLSLVTKPDTWPSGDNNCPKLMHQIISATVTEQLEAAVKDFGLLRVVWL